MSKENKHIYVLGKVASIYNKLDEACGFKEPGTALTQKQKEEKKNHPNRPTCCNVCLYRNNSCWIRFTRNGELKNDRCRNISIDEKEQLRLDEILRLTSDNKNEDTERTNE
jgi:hypothetical protein